MVEWRGLAGAVWWERIAGFCQSLHLKSSMSWLPPIWWCWWWTLRLPSLPTLFPDADMFYVLWNGCFLFSGSFSGVQYLMSQLFRVTCDFRANLATESKAETFWINTLVLIYSQIKCEIYSIQVLHDTQLSCSPTFHHNTQFSQCTLKASTFIAWISLPLKLQNVKWNMKLLPLHRQ